MSLDGTTKLEQAKQIVRWLNVTDAAIARTDRQTEDLCGLFQLNSVSKQRFELSLNQAQAGAGTSSNTLNLSGGALTGTFEQVWTARPWNEQQPTPVFTDLQNSLNKKVRSGSDNVKHYAVEIVNNGVNACTFTEIGGSLIASVTWASNFKCTINWNVGAWTLYNCIVTPQGSGEASISSKSNSLLQVAQTTSTGAAHSGTTFTQCHGFGN